MNQMLHHRTPTVSSRLKCIAAALALFSSFFYGNAQADLTRSIEGYGFTLYGFVRPTYSFATDAVSSFGSSTGTGAGARWQRDNQVAATEAAPSTGVTAYDSSRSHLTIGQSRIGASAQSDRALVKFELDFVDFDRSEATTSIRPRLRAIGAQLKLSDHWRLFGGQDWDITSGPKPFTFNYVSLYFRAGNIGFMRPQFIVTRVDDKERETFSWAIGAAGLNESDSNSSGIERGVAPSLGFRWNWLRLPTFTAGLAALGAPRRLESTDGRVKTRAAWVAKAYAVAKPCADLEMRSSLFGGTNAQSTGAILSLANATFASNESEIGGFLTLSYHVLAPLELQLGSGIDSVLGGAEDRSGQLFRNWVSRVGAGYLLFDKARLFGEITRFQSDYAWDRLQRLRNSSIQVETGLSVEI